MIWLTPPLQKAFQTWSLDPLFVTLTGVHLYGFPSPDSDYDLRGAYVLPLRQVIGLQKPRETATRLAYVGEMKIDLVLHDIGKYLRMLAHGNGGIVEEIFSPLVVIGDGNLATLRELARGCLVRRLYYHYDGFARSQIEKLETQEPKRVKTLLYIYRILMAGIHILETGEVESNILRLNESFRFGFIPDLIAAKTEELSPLGDVDWDFHRQIWEGLQARLHEAFQSSCLPQQLTGLAELEDYLLRIRLSSGGDLSCLGESFL